MHWAQHLRSRFTTFFLKTIQNHAFVLLCFSSHQVWKDSVGRVKCDDDNSRNLPMFIFSGSKVWIYNCDSGQQIGIWYCFLSKYHWIKQKVKYCWRSLIRSSRGIRFSSNKGAYQIIERRLWEFLVDGDFKFDRNRERME